MKAELEAILDLQPSWVASAPSEEMQLRGFFVREDVADFVRSHVDELAARLLCDVEDVDIEGKDSTGFYSRVPWVRFANRQLSPNPRTGWYAVYLFAEDGSEVCLSLNQGTQVWDGVGMRSRPDAQIRSRSDWARSALADAISERSRLDEVIVLGQGDKSRAYEAGNVAAYRYPRNHVPDDGALASDLADMAALLQLLYQAEARMPAPGDPPPEIVEAERAVQEIAGRRPPRRTGFRVNPKQRRAVELRAMELATAYFVELGGIVKDVSALRPFDLSVDLHGTKLSVEVKGTTGSGDEVLLTRGEVEHHLGSHPANALVVVAGVQLGGPPDAPEATGGELRVIQPWLVESDALKALSYRYAVPSTSAP